MKSGKCPKCGSNEVYTKHNGFQGHFTIVVGFANVKTPQFDDYVCLKCGYYESYISNLNDLQEIASKWTKAG